MKKKFFLQYKIVNFIRFSLIEIKKKLFVSIILNYFQNKNKEVKIYHHIDIIFMIFFNNLVFAKVIVERK